MEKNKTDKISKTRQKINKLYEENEYASLEQNKNRARSLTVGTAGGGVIELGMRGDYANLWYQLQPVEAVELINQLASVSGLEIAMRPKQDFSTWRGWDTSLPASIHWVGAAPWQLSEEQRLELEAMKAKNIKSIQSSNESE
jgi:hypothetical protein